jgi:hypothetical protein
LGLFAGIITGRILSRALQNPRSKGIVICFVSFAVPVFIGQMFLRTLSYGHYVAVNTYGVLALILTFCIGAIEVGLLLWFIRDWGLPLSTQSSN